MLILIGVVTFREKNDFAIDLTPRPQGQDGLGLRDLLKPSIPSEQWSSEMGESFALGKIQALASGPSVSSACQRLTALSPFFNAYDDGASTPH